MPPTLTALLNILVNILDILDILNILENQRFDERRYLCRWARATRPPFREGQDARERTSKMRKLKYHEQKLLKKVRD